MIIFLHGEDDFRAKKKMKEIKRQYISNVDKSGDSIVYLDGETISFADFSNSIKANSLFVAKKLVIIEGLFLNKKKEIFVDILELIKKIEKNHEGSTVAFREKNIGKSPTKAKKELWKILGGSKISQEFKILSNTDVSHWIRSEVQKRGGQISLNCAAELATITKNDLWRIDKEIDKLLSFKVDKQIEAEMITELVKGEFDENIFNLTDAIAARRKEVVVKLYEEMVEGGMSEDYILSMLIWQFKQLLQVRQAVENGHTPRKITSELKLHPFVVQKNVAHARSFKLDYLKEIFSRLVLINRGFRENRETAIINLGLFFAKL